MIEGMTEDPNKAISSINFLRLVFDTFQFDFVLKI